MTVMTVHTKKMRIICDLVSMISVRFPALPSKTRTLTEHKTLCQLNPILRCFIQGEFDTTTLYINHTCPCRRQQEGRRNKKDTTNTYQFLPCMSSGPQSTGHAGISEYLACLSLNCAYGFCNPSASLCLPLNYPSTLRSLRIR